VEPMRPADCPARTNSRRYRGRLSSLLPVAGGAIRGEATFVTASSELDRQVRLSAHAAARESGKALTLRLGPFQDHASHTRPLIRGLVLDRAL
jgi:hypothetical protein